MKRNDATLSKVLTLMMLHQSMTKRKSWDPEMTSFYNIIFPNCGMQKNSPKDNVIEGAYERITRKVKQIYEMKRGIKQMNSEFNFS